MIAILAILCPVVMASSSAAAAAAAGSYPEGQADVALEAEC